MIIQTRPKFDPTDAPLYQVYLNGRKLMRCFYADDEAGIARIDGETGEPVELHGVMTFERVGEVWG